MLIFQCRGKKTRFRRPVLLLAALAFACGTSAFYGQQSVQTNSAQDAFLGSVPTGQTSPGVIDLTLQEAVQRGLRANLGLLLSNEATQDARGRRWQALSHLLPSINGTVTGTEQEIDLLPMVGPNTLPPQISAYPAPFDVYDARLHVSIPVWNMSALESAHSASHHQLAANFSYQQARDTVVLAVGNAYLMAVAGKARVEAATAERDTAQALYQLAVDRENSGLSPQIDTLRALVELKSREEGLLTAKNEYATEKLNLARAIGLPNGQKIRLSSQVPYQTMSSPALEEALAQAYQHRGDYQSAAAEVAEAEAQLRSARAERYPSLGVDANWGEIGTGDSATQTYAVTGSLQVPLFQGRRVHGEVQAAEAHLRQSRDKLADLKQQIDYDVRTAIMNLETNAGQVQVARTNTTLASQTLDQARDRFASGVTDNIEVVQAQQTMSQADETYIDGLYRYNLSKLYLARAMGVAERDGLNYLGEK